MPGLDIAGEGEDPSLGIRRIMEMFVTGVTIISVRVGELVHGMTANAFMSVSLAPPLVLVSVDKTDANVWTPPRRASIRNQCSG